MRNNKYDWLSENYIDTTKWQEINPKSEFYLFIERDEKLLERYEQYPKITDIFPVNSVGIVTSRDSFVIDYDKNTLRRRILQFRDRKMPDEIIRQTYDLKDKAHWKLKDARESVIKDDEWEQAITKILYRPFDERWIFYHDAVVERSRKEVMRHMISENLGLIVPRQVKLDFHHTYCTTHITNFNALDTAGSFGSGFLFPLYIYKQKDKSAKRSLGSVMMLFEPETPYKTKRPNISETLLKSLSSAYKKQPTPEEIFYYIYALLYSDTYRAKFAEFLKIDFPRVPFTTDYKLFKKMGEYGKKLVDLHLMKLEDLDTPVAKFQGMGNNKVEKLKYNEEENRLFINKDQYFKGITEDVWQYQVGGYQVCDKWLKDRKGKVLSVDDIKHYCKIVTSLQKTIEIQKEINEIYPEVEAETIAM